MTTNRPFFFSLGQVRKKKNFHILVDVMKNFPEYDLYISGQDHYEYAKEIRQRILDEKIKNIFLTGTIKNEEKVWLYKNCTAFLFPSTLEGFGLPVIEAMQFGRAVFSSNYTSLPEVCGGNAFIWDNFNPDYMTQVMKENLKNFYDDKKKIAMMKEHAFSFSYEKHIQQYIHIYKTLLKKEN
ncbi:glycosyltransferase [uncultured Bacteroides sp.]|uniref:glycosyltransferase n=1 Tax=uncultured Bacteroides sp. TaxID=162156 RepID=UPI002AA84933|nr:glycosyltransferase [uncultured Bacteroides sp.]